MNPLYVPLVHAQKYLVCISLRPAWVKSTFCGVMEKRNGGMEDENLESIIEA